MVKRCSLLCLYLYLFHPSHLTTSWYPVSALHLFHETTTGLWLTNSLMILFSLNLCDEAHKWFSNIFLQVIRLLKERNKRMRSAEVEAWLFRKPWPTFQEICVLTYCSQWLLGCRTKQNWLNSSGLNFTHTQKTKSTQTQDGGKKNTEWGKSLYFDPYLHLTSVSHDLESGPERKDEGKLII